ncbi:MAG: hypothetical protein ACYC26_15095, partial [Phycisphaerales bacterium]
MCNVRCAMRDMQCSQAEAERVCERRLGFFKHRTSNIAFSYVATCQPVLGWGAGIVSGSGQSAIGARNLDGHAAHEIV